MRRGIESGDDGNDDEAFATAHGTGAPSAPGVYDLSVGDHDPVDEVRLGAILGEGLVISSTL